LPPTPGRAEGNDFVLGPLGRDEVSAVFRQTSLAVPMLALNRGNVTAPAGSASFSLSPEDEGIAAAEYMIARNARRALVIAGTDDGMRRAVATFRQRYANVAAVSSRASMSANRSASRLLACRPPRRRKAASMPCSWR
jgi:outer membrane PBP1 activator LpoA protein